jgi:hypothetical protein
VRIFRRLMATDPCSGGDDNRWARALESLRTARSASSGSADSRYELEGVHKELRGSLDLLANDMVSTSDSVAMDVQIRVLGNLVADDGTFTNVDL